MKKGHKEEVNAELVMALGILLSFIILFAPAVLATPTGPDSIVSIANETKSTTNGVGFNISGGYISTFNLTASVQNPHWKAFVGNVTGVFTLDDSSGSTIYDWTLNSVSGEVYATRASGAITWSNVNCSNQTHINYEDNALWHDGEDNISSTFDGNNAATFVVAGNSILAGTCRATNTYVNNASGSDFEEVVLNDFANNTIFTTILENNAVGFDGGLYDFQMIVPENGSDSWTGRIVYYVYVELS
jgi:hypothetical protein